MSGSHQPEVSFILATYNRRAVVTETLARLTRCGIDRRDYEVIVVDNASSDGTPDAVAGQSDVLIRLRRNAGSCAKAYGVDVARGRYVVFLDDDSNPHPGSVARMIERFEDDPKLGAAGFAVHLPDGGQEGGALPGVFVGCGVGLRAEALRVVGGLDRSFFMQAEEYDLAFRLVGAGWRVKVFDDLHVDHLKTPCARRSARTTYYDIRNNLRVVARYLPPAHYNAYRRDWLQRYAWLAQRDGHTRSFGRGALAGRLRGVVERRTHRKYRLSASALEHFFRWEYVRRKMAELATGGTRRIVLADLGKNIFAFHRAANETGMTVLAIGDDRFRAGGRRYRGIPVVSLEDVLRLDADTVVVANSAVVHGTDTYNRLVRRVGKRASPPVHHWFAPTGYAPTDGICSPAPEQLADDDSVERALAARS